MFDDQAVRHANGWFRHSAVHAFHRSDRLLVWSVCRHYDRSGLRSGTVRAGADFLHNPADALGLPAGIRCSGSCRFL